MHTVGNTEELFDFFEGDKSGRSGSGCPINRKSPFGSLIRPTSQGLSEAGRFMVTS